MKYKGKDYSASEKYYTMIFFKGVFYLFVAVLGLCCCAAFLLLQQAGLLFTVAHEPLIPVASLVAEHGL